MKLFYTYTSPHHCFSEGDEKLMRIQIDNDLELGWRWHLQTGQAWRPQNILLYTNFSYEYRGVVAQQVPDIYAEFDPTSNKIPVILHLLREQQLDYDLYWYHDLDVYQCEAFVPPHVRKFGIARYGYKHDWQCGSFFFRPHMQTVEFFDIWNHEIQTIPTWSEYAKTRTDEKALKSLVLQKKLVVEELNHRYNHVFKYADWTYARADKPILASHFHPEPESMARMVHGKNKHKIPFVPARLKDIFQRHGFV